MSDEIVVAPIDVALAVESPATLPEKREFVINRPGHINYAEARGNYVGCELKSFDGVGQINNYFREHANLLVVGIWSHPDHIDVLYTNTLEGEELEEFNEYSRSIHMHMSEWRQARAERSAKRDESAANAEAEVKRLVAKGKKCENDHGGLDKKRGKK